PGPGGAPSRGRGGPPSRGAAPPAHRHPSPPPFDPDDEDNFDPQPPPPPPVRQAVRTAPAWQPPPAPARQQPAPSARQPPPPIRAGSSADIEVRCNCNAPAVQRTVTRESETKGKKFWTCETRGCTFFSWVDDAPVASGSRAIPAKRSYSEQQDSGDGGRPVRKCKCNLTAVQRTVRKEGANQGRIFWKCPNVQGAECGTFEWDDEPSQSSNNRAPASSFGAAGGSGSFGAGRSREQDVCYKCNLSGHWASACPNGEGSATKKARSFGSTDSGSSAACYKCNEVGHYSADCPTTGGRTKSKGGSALTCFKCGEEGHFATACTSESSPSRRSSSSSNSRGTAKRGRGSSRGKGGRGKKRTFGLPT
ncbi:hypothetical protein C8R45DRAFT_864161, partial [Mycena sanguinolenta]